MDAVKQMITSNYYPVINQLSEIHSDNQIGSGDDSIRQ